MTDSPNKALSEAFKKYERIREDDIKLRIKLAVQAETEACAQLVEDLDGEWGGQRIAEKIRGRLSRD